MENRRDEMLRMRNDGCTFEEIGRSFGISKQRVEQIVNKGGRHRRSIEKIAYKGIYELFVNDESMTFRRFAIIATDNASKQVATPVTNRFRYILTNEEYGKLSLNEIRNILAYTGMTFEQAFELRNKGDGE